MAARASKTVIYAALLGNMLSEAVHSTVDTGNQALKHAARPPDAEYPFGHGLQLYFWVFVVAVLIFGVGAGLSLYHGIEKVRHPQPIENAYVGLNFILIGMLHLSMLQAAAAWIGRILTVSSGSRIALPAPYSKQATPCTGLSQ